MCTEKSLTVGGIPLMVLSRLLSTVIEASLSCSDCVTVVTGIIRMCSSTSESSVLSVSSSDNASAISCLIQAR